MLAVTSQSRYRTGRYVVDLATRRLLLDGKLIELPWRCFEALALLVESQGGIVDRETFFRKLWPGIEVEETSLTKVLSQLRRTLAAGDPAAEYVETVPRLGYRLAIPVRPDQHTNGIQLTSTPGLSVPSRRKLLWLVAALAVLGVAGTAGAWGWRRYQRLADAENNYQEGNRLKRLSDPASVRGAIEALRRATELNPRKAGYFSALAQALGKVPQPVDFQPMRQAGERGVELDPGCAGCQATLGFILFSRFWEWEKAGVHLREGLRLAPDDAGLRGYLAMYYSSQSKPSEALAHIEEAIRIAPFSSRSHQLKTTVLCLLGRYQEAVAASDRALSLDPQDKAALDWRAHALLLAGNEREGLAAWSEHSWKEQAAEIDKLYAAKGLGGALRRLIEMTGDSKLREPNSYRRAQWKMHLGKHKEAIQELSTAVQFHHFNLIYVAADPVFAPIRSRPEFQSILRRVGLWTVASQTSAHNAFKTSRLYSRWRRSGVNTSRVMVPS